MEKNFTKKQINTLNIFLNNELEIIEKKITLNNKSKEKTKKNILDYSKCAFFLRNKSKLFILN
tara:strand:+ start:617 stop:805 length:189 start_codon:yes stop_codon:yes gene_type:complete